MIAYANGVCKWRVHVSPIEIINNTRGGIEGKIGERGVWGGQIQVPDVHSFTMSQKKKSF